MAVRDRRWYCSLQDLKAELGITSTDYDTILSRYIERASRWIENVTGRTFIPVTATKYFDCPHPSEPLFLEYEDLLSVTTLSDDEGTITAADYWLYPHNMNPKHSVVLETSDRTWYYSVEPNRAVSVAGSWGFSDDYEATGVTLATASGITTSATTSITVTAANVLEVGWSILVDTEQMFVTDTNSTDATVQRGNNGTTAATHSASTTVYRYVPPVDIEQACVMLAAGWYNQRTSGASTGVKSETIGEYSVVYGGEAVPQAVMDIINRYQRVGG